MNKRLIIIPLAIVAVLLGVLLSNITKPPTKITPPVRYAASPPAITLVPDAPSNVKFVFQGNEQGFPTALPLYQFSNSGYSKNQMEAIAKAVGFTSLPTTVQFGTKSMVSWSMPAGKLSYYNNGVDRIWSHTLFQSQVRTKPTTALSLLAKSFFEKVFLSKDHPPLVLLEELPGPFEDMHITDATKPKLYGYAFTPRVNNQYSITTQLFDLSAASCIIDEFGVIRSFSFSAPPLITMTKSLPLISISDAIISLNNNRGVLVFASKDNESYLEEKLLFQSATLNDVQLVYYPDKTIMLLLPYYLFSGQTITTEGKPLILRYAVAAVESY
ncbi:MAG: hypothetical protein UU25_C0019G0004 [Microgenomates group bacterium GW2011_GWB1_40_9]|nr:MAG: hypothetical protein UT26_C0033G0004 [Microgenomates group bacterium GW2011_GWC1_39_12]KKR79266.1 MAG: hypothetical protein UU25_C0019G0004 [Microgenomates group bacterium GW2011_GWB1_40_9]